MKTQLTSTSVFPLRALLRTSLIACALQAHPLAAELPRVTLESQWQRLPEVTSKPESGSMPSQIGLPAGSAAGAAARAGGSAWANNVQQPQTVPVEFYLEFKSNQSTGFATLAGATVSGIDPLDFSKPYHPLFPTPSATVNLKPNQTYTLTFGGQSTYAAEVTLAPPDLSRVFSSPSVANQPARRYNVYYLDPATKTWLKACSDRKPSWVTPRDLWEDFTTSFQIQVRPDLGARPVTKAGQKLSNGDDQADDAWTGEEPPIDASTAPGDGTPVTLSSSRLGDPTAARFSWSASLGRLWTGRGAGRIGLDETRISSNACTPAALIFVPRSEDTNELTTLMDLDETNWIAQIRAPQCLVTVDPLYGSALFLTNHFLSPRLLTQKLTNHVDAVSQYLWTNFTSAGQQTLVNTNSSELQLRSTLAAELNPILQNQAVYDANRFAGVSLSGRSWRLLIASPQGQTLVRLNRFLIEDAYPTELSRLESTRFSVGFFDPSFAGSPDYLGFFTIAAGASPFVTWEMGLPQGVTNQWCQREIRNGITNTTTLQFDLANKLWTLTRGLGNEARIETRAVATNVPGTNFCTEVQEVKNGFGTVSDRTAELYQLFDWGYELVAVTNDPGGANLVTTFSFNANTNDLAGGGKISCIVYPDGFWERREYSDVEDPLESPLGAQRGALIRVVQPWKNSPITAETPDCFVTDYEYVLSAGPGSYRLVKWHDQTGERPWYATGDYTNLIVTADMGAFIEEFDTYQDECGYFDLITQTHEVGNFSGYGEWQDTTSFGPQYTHLSGHLFSKIYDLRREDAYDYEFGTWTPASLSFTPNQDPLTPDPQNGHDMRQTIFHGLDSTLGFAGDLLWSGPSGANFEPVTLEPLRSTMEVRIISDGNLVLKELYVYEGSLTNFGLLEQVAYQRDSLGHATNVFRTDPATHQTRVIYKSDWTGQASRPGDLKLSETDEDGAVYVFTYDSLKRLKTKTRQPGAGQYAIVTTLSYDAANRILTNITSAGSLSQRVTAHFDLAGRKTDETDTTGLTTSYSYQNGGRQTTITQSSGATTVISNYLDRRVASITGTAVTNLFYDYAIDPTAGWSEDTRQPRNVTTTHYGAADSLRWTATYTDHKYQLTHEVKPAFHNTNSLYKSYQSFLRGHIGQPDFVEVTGLVADGERYPGYPNRTGGNGFVTEFKYDYSGNRVAASSGNPLDYPATWWEPASAARLTTFTNFYEKDGQNHWFRVAEQYTYPFDNNATVSLVERSRQRLTGFAANEISEIRRFDVDTNETIVKVTVDLPNRALTTTTTIAQSSLSAVQVAVNGLLQTETTPTVPAPTTHYYDALGREIGVVDPLGNRTGTRYDPTTGQVTATTNAQGLVTTMEYYGASGTNAGLLKCVTGPTGKRTYYNYNGRGQVTHIWGDVPYPEKRDYNAFGDQIALTTYRGGNQWTGSAWPSTTGDSDVTQWFYEEATGLLTNKTDAAGRSVTFDYYDNHFPKTRVWARGTACTNIYEPVYGGLVHIDYSDGTSVTFTNDTFLALNRLGKPSIITDASGTSFPTYDHGGRLRSTSYTEGLLAGITITNHLHPVYGRDTLQVTGITPGLTTSFGYDNYGRMASVASGIYSAAYAYLPNSDLLQSTTCKKDGTNVLTTTRTWETGPRLRSIVNTTSDGAVVSAHSYRYDALDRRRQAQLEDGSTWNYDYNDRSELTGARRYWHDWSPVSGQQFAYDYDNIGNRESAGSGGNSSGCNLRLTTYSANNLNQYTTITNAGYEDISGAAFATNTVGVTNAITGLGVLADRKGEYFHGEVDINNATPLWQTVAVGSVGSVSNGGFAFPAANQTLTYDWDGNLTSDGIWAYEWSPENRLSAMSMTAITGVPDSKRLRLEFVYDYQGRRISKTVKSWNGSAFSNQTTTLFVYDGWNVVAILNPQLSALKAFLWGQDLSGTEAGAGGIGGLVAILEVVVSEVSNSHFAAYDGNGNITGLTRSGDLLPSARYDYSPFGETLRATGPFALVNPFRCSTKFVDDESGFSCFGHRYYIPQFARWLSRDPVEERDQNNLYAFVQNSPLTGLDPLGASLVELPITIGKDYADKTWELVRASNIIRNVRRFKNEMENLQNFTSGLMDAGEFEISELLQDINKAQHDLATGLRGSRSYAKSLVGDFEDHHIWPRAKGLRRLFAGINIDNIQVKMDAYIHQFGVHQKGTGGRYNDIWKRLKNAKGKNINPYYLLGFGFGIIGRLPI